MLLSQSAKPDSFNLFAQLKDPENQQAAPLNSLYNLALLLCTQIFRVNLKSQEEFSHIVEELGLRPKASEMQKVFSNAYLKRVEQLGNVYEDEQASMTQQYSKKFPLNMAMAEESLVVSNARIVDIEWRILYQLSSKNLNKLFEPRFLITLLVLAQNGFVEGGAAEIQPSFGSKRDYLKLRKVQFECDREELTHLIYKLKSGCNALESMIKPPKQ